MITKQQLDALAAELQSLEADAPVLEAELRQAQAELDALWGDYRHNDGKLTAVTVAQGRVTGLQSLIERHQDAIRATADELAALDALEQGDPTLMEQFRKKWAYLRARG